MSHNLAAFAYLFSSICFIMALRGLSSPDTARAGNIYGIVGMVIAVATTLATPGVLSYTMIFVAVLIGGAIGNAIDRPHIGGVADFVSLHAFGFRWYIFNVADVAIVAGIIGLLYDSVVLSRNGAAKGT